MLQDVYKGTGGAKASSLYCVWVCGENEMHPVAVWIDSEMRAFAGHCSGESSSEAMVGCIPEQCMVLSRIMKNER